MDDESDDPGELEAEERLLAERLENGRPYPNAGFNGALGRYLATHDPGYGPRPERLRPMVAGWLAAGGLLMAVGALQATGVL